MVSIRVPYHSSTEIMPTALLCTRHLGRRRPWAFPTSASRSVLSFNHLVCEVAHYQNSIPCIVITQTSHTITHDQPVNTALHLLTAFDSILHEMGESDAAERLLALSEDARENLMSDEAALETFFDVLPGIRIDTAKFELEVVRELADTVIASAEQRHVHRSNTWALVPKFFDRIRNAVGQAQMGSVSCVDLPVGSKKRAFDAFDDVILEGDFNVAHDSQARKRTRFEPLEIGNGVASFLQEEESQPGGALSGTASPDSPWSW